MINQVSVYRQPPVSGCRQVKTI
ncbi:hypothetical protein [Shigella dysenteriae]|nr:hypothetical protein [Shigella dysenteriae]WNT52769.1 hypothetical protein PWP84_16165 [Shigella dysenteriae]